MLPLKVVTSSASNATLPALHAIAQERIAAAYAPFAAMERARDPHWHHYLSTVAQTASTPRATPSIWRRVESYEDTVSDRYGFETARVAGHRPGRIEGAGAYDHLMRPMVARTARMRGKSGAGCWRKLRSHWHEEDRVQPRDMANRLTVRYSEPGGRARR